MLLWIILTLMTSVAAVWLATPLLVRLDERRAAGADALEVYRDQLSEVAREKADGMIDAELADSANLEIKRRMLNTGRLQAAKTNILTLGERHFAVVSVVGLVVLGSTILYSNTGRPDLPSVARTPTSLVLGDGTQGASFQPTNGQRTAAQPAAATPASVQTSQAQATGQPATGGTRVGSVDEMIQRLVDRLKKDPANADTLQMLGWSYFASEHYGEAADAYRKAVDVQPNNAALLASYGEASVRAADGQVKPDAIAIFDRALAVEPKNAHARYYKGVVLVQAGNKRGALDGWLEVLADAGPDDPWTTELRTKVTTLASELGVDVSARVPKVAGERGGILDILNDSGVAPAPAVATKTPPPGGPSAEDVKAAEAMPPTDRSAMIRGMVDGLAAKLEKAPRDADNWIKLIRSRKVLGDGDAAKAALVKALAAFGDAPEEQQRITASALQSGVTP